MLLHISPCLTHEGLSTLMAEVTAIINTHLLETELPFLLTPAMILTQKLGEYHQPVNSNKHLATTIYPCPVSEGPKESHLGGVWPDNPATVTHLPIKFGGDGADFDVSSYLGNALTYRNKI
ncbi:hypothetical protein N1851_024150 [Merluccius polli]|uniref:Uncharacterized protein n=1 Tax=Merluccius polli TaxID=89951 RepID=A0AA47MF99_MERPO|nr:hypothetical protein N1851_024150 [Merluccius polli]